ncbi:MAG TPA: hypothetical protein VJ724_15985, partial [Tahibacter sp.]|nr:hypothetical protein [Tahibacter sp.]
TLLFCATAFAAEPPANAPAPAAKPADRPATSAMRVYMDPKTGKLVEAPLAPVPKDAAHGVDLSKIVEVRHADGTIETQFNGQADSTLVVETGPDGTLRYRCSEHGALHDHAAPESSDEHR